MGVEVGAGGGAEVGSGAGGPEMGGGAGVGDGAESGNGAVSAMVSDDGEATLQVASASDAVAPGGASPLESTAEMSRACTAAMTSLRMCSLRLLASESDPDLWAALRLRSARACVLRLPLDPVLVWVASVPDSGSEWSGTWLWPGMYLPCVAGPEDALRERRRRRVPEAAATAGWKVADQERPPTRAALREPRYRGSPAEGLAGLRR
ncbi:hypothetical protein CYMTET_52097 [Cymbomonas tetramitiformis]|uniref:Uncharacterized protein n=1 Tax=Cymbomonas tetramitiformis TaxID=36881 RepID=A0AAE0BLI1_9CHLO|nr:hypothetical protein CYMTET_52097 [Cymbomonas tetramitiformis]